MRINAAPREVHPEGTYHFTLRAIREVGQRSFTPKGADEPVTVTSIRVGAQSESGAYVWDSFDVDGPMAWRLTALAEAIYGRRFKQGETFDTDQLLDKPFGATVQHNEGAQGTFTNLRDIFTVAGVAATVPAAPKKVLPLAAKTKPTLRPLPGALKKTTKK